MHCGMLAQYLCLQMYQCRFPVPNYTVFQTVFTFWSFEVAVRCLRNVKNEIH